jgi:phosphatidyl-myo-inositol dimannoside synthase
MLGFVADGDLAQWYAAADIFALPAVVDSSGDTEGLGVVLLEAMANGTPVVASRTGGIADIVKHGETGLLAEPGNAADLAAQIRRLMADKALRARLIDSGTKLVNDQFSWRAVNQSLLAVYNRVLNSGSNLVSEI